MTNDLTETNLMKHLMDNIRDNIYFMDRNGRIILINKEGTKWLGYESPDDLIGKTDLDIFTDEHGRAAYEDEQRIMESGVPILGKEEKETWEDGRETWVSTSKMPLRDDNGKIVGTFGISRDITEHKKAEILAEQLAEENREFREAMEDELHMAAELQKTFFPASYPVFPEGASGADSVVKFSNFHHSCGMVGGDFCSVRKLSDTEVGILLCDVMGHGVRAALCTAMMRAMVEEISDQYMDPSAFLGHMNRALVPILRQGGQFLFATACYMILDVSTGLLRYSNAGHPDPIRFNRSGAEWLDALLPGAALAVNPDAEYKTAEVQVQTGDSLFMFTDGIYEIEKADGEEYGPERLLTLVQENCELKLSDLFPVLLKESRQFSASGELDDDVCLVGFRLDHLLD